jgi:Domain of unknown function (DUF5615)
MSIFASVYTDEDVAKLVSTLLKARGINATNTPAQGKISEPDEAQLAFAASIQHCILTHNRVDFEQLHLQYIEEGETHSGIMIAPRKTPQEIVLRAMVLLDALTADEIANQLLYL